MQKDTSLPLAYQGRSTRSAVWCVYVTVFVCCMSMPVIPILPGTLHAHTHAGNCNVSASTLSTGRPSWSLGCSEYEGAARWNVEGITSFGRVGTSTERGAAATAAPPLCVQAVRCYCVSDTVESVIVDA